MRTLPLSNGKVALVDADVPEAWFKLRWTVHRGGYPQTSISGKRIFLHVLVMGARTGFIVDHINGDTYDNRTSNLRFCTDQQNSFNRKTNSNNTSGYKGVSVLKKGRKIWRAEIWAYGKKYYLGDFHTREEAALAYNEAALKYHGEYARLNVIPQPLHP